MNKLLREIRDSGLVIENVKSLEIQIMRKSFYRYSKLMNIYKKKNNVSKVSQTTINNIYKDDIRLRRELQKVLTALEVTMRAELHNTFHDFKGGKVNKQKTEGENYFLVSDVSKRNPYIYARRGFRGGKGGEILFIQDYINNMTFGHLIATYFAVNSEKVNKDYRNIPLTLENQEKLDSIRLARNLLAHHGFLFEYKEKELKGIIKSTFELVEFDKKNRDRIHKLLKLLYSH